MEGSQAAASTKVDSAAAVLRPVAHGQFKLLPVVVRDLAEWNGRIVRWAGAA